MDRVLAADAAARAWFFKVYLDENAIGTALVREDKLSIGGSPVTAKHYRVTGPRFPLELWYSENGDWLGLESHVAGGRRLRYRLE